MSNAKHTPGQWSVVHADRGYIVTAMDCCYDIAVVRNIGNQDNKANAELIAAAPELLEALEAWEKAIPRLDEFASVSPDSLRGKAIAAIAKARGE